MGLSICLPKHCFNFQGAQRSFCKEGVVRRCYKEGRREGGLSSVHMYCVVCLYFMCI